MRTKTKPIASKKDEAKLIAFLKQFPDGVWSMGTVPKHYKKGAYKPTADEIIAGAKLAAGAKTK